MTIKGSIAVIGLMASSCSMFGQDRVLPEPEYVAVFYAYDSASNKLLDLERQTLQGATKLKAFGYAGIKNTFEVPGDRSSVRFFSGQKLTFVFKSSADFDPQTQAEIVKLTPKKGHREILYMQSKGYMGFGGVKAEGAKADVSFSSSKYRESSIGVSPVEPLPPGEYAIRAPQSLSVFCFGIDESGTAPTASREAPAASSGSSAQVTGLPSTQEATISSAPVTKGAIKQAIEAKYTLAQPTVDHKDLTAAGAVIDLLKDDLVLGTTAQVTTDADGKPLYATEPMSTYKNGKFREADSTSLCLVRSTT